MEKTEKVSFVDYMVQRRKIKQEFFDQINTLVNWRPISNIINKHYHKGESKMGRPSYSGLVLFKMTLLQTWYGLSDYEVEDRINDSISFSRFVGISLDDSVPDHSVISRFRSSLTEKGVYENLFKELNKQLNKHKILVKRGAIVDASIVDSPLKPKGKVIYEIESDRSEHPREDSELDKENSEQLLIQQESPGVDHEARWIKKAGKTRYGYKKHYVTDTEG
ncbi:IS5 family transposase, partial [Sphingobacterium sp. UBA7253]